MSNKKKYKTMTLQIDYLCKDSDLIDYLIKSPKIGRVQEIKTLKV